MKLAWPSLTIFSTAVRKKSVHRRPEYEANGTQCKVITQCFHLQSNIIYTFTLSEWIYSVDMAHSLYIYNTAIMNVENDRYGRTTNFQINISQFWTVTFCT